MNRPTILIVDDDRSTVRILKDRLATEGYSTAEAYDGHEALEKAVSLQPDAVLLDIRLPGELDGYAVCRILKQHSPFLPIILVTAKDTVDDLVKGLDIGADDYIAKPFNKIELLARLRSLLRIGDLYRLLNEKNAELDREKQRIEVIIHHLYEGLLSTDPDGRIRFVNAAAERLSGFSSSELIGTQSEFLLIYPDETPFTPGEIISEVDLLLKRKEKRPLPIVASVTVMTAEGEEYLGYVVIFRDVSEEKQLEKLKDDLTEMIAHDLRNALGRIEISAQMLLSGAVGDLNSKQTKYVQASLDSTRRLLGMTSDLLDISRLEINKMPITKEPVDLAAVIDQSLESFRPSAEDRQIVFIIEMTEGIPEPVADKQKLIRVIENLVGNAMKFSPDGSTVTIRVDYDLEAQQIVIRIIDQGEGIPEEYLSRIFEKFAQVEDRKKGRKEGSGLGLTFCKLVVHAHGGKIRVESKIGEGSTFIFTLPL